ncbi:MAG: oligosaccharide repeat unit polymerase [Deltaproteobacteria bacterium]|nr:MAG: oligosaccharide repeat unit polymerase [Deltaproteobacteria bacterium]
MQGKILYTGANSKPVIKNLAFLYFVLLAGVSGILVFSGINWLIPIYFSLAYIMLSFAALTVTHFWRDCLNPVLFVLVLGFVRFSIPGFLSLRAEPDLLLFQMMGLDSEAWILGHALALAGLLGVVMGWLMPMQLPGRRLLGILAIFRIRSGIPYAAILGICVGFAALLVFVRSHGPILEAVGTGEMRSTEINQGTGKYFYLGLMLISSSVVFSAYLMRRRYAWWLTPLPSLLAASTFWVLGGRSRAFVPMACVALLLWYRRDELKVPMRTVFALTLVLLPVLSYVGLSYRGGEGMNAFTQIFSLSALADYVNYAVWIDWGQLHSLAGAIAIGPGVLGGQTFSYNLLWPVSQFLDLPGKSAGVLIVQTLLGESERSWGFHATLVGEAYLNFGIAGVFVVTAILGVILKVLYVGFRQGQIDGAYYSLAVIYSMRIFFESVEKFGEALVVLIFAFSVIRVGETLFDIWPYKRWGDRTLGISAGRHEGTLGKSP